MRNNAMKFVGLAVVFLGELASLPIALGAANTSLVSTGSTAGASAQTKQFLKSLEGVKRVSLSEMDQIRRVFNSQTARSPVGPLSAAGGWNGGGGEGIACWSTNEEAADALDADGRLKPEARKSIRALYSADLWEFSDKVVYLPPKSAHTADQYLRDLTLEIIMPVSPYLGQRLLETAHLLHAAEDRRIWNALPPGAALVKINDAGSRAREMKPNCRAVQMVVRYLQRRPGEKFPRVFIDYDKDLYDKFLKLSPNAVDGIMFQAGLRLHEQLYAIGAEIGMNDSSMTRKLTALLMSDTLWSKLQSLPEHRRISTLYSVIYGIGFRHISWIYAQPREQKQTPKPFTKLSRQLARAHLALKYENLLIEILGAERMNTGWKTNDEEFRFIDRMTEVLDDEESFLFLASNEFNAGRSKYSGDIFITDLIDDNKGFAFLCDHFGKRKAMVDRGETRFTPVSQLTLYNKAVRYCAGVKPISD